MMTASRIFKIFAICTGIGVLFLLMFSRSACGVGECEVVSKRSISYDIARSLGFYEDVELPDELNVLVVGVDSRKGSSTVHCDAIHMVHIDLANERLHFVNVPRGTFSYIPGQPPTEQYLANVCNFIDVDTFVERVGVITGYDADYRVIVGFSQAQGLLRALEFNPTTTLQYLRHRQSYQIGDPQRSYNQSIFLSDLVVNKTDVIDSIPLPARFALFQLLDTDMTHSYADALYSWLSRSKIPGDSSRITHSTKPDWTPMATEMRFDEADYTLQLEHLYDILKLYDPTFVVTELKFTLDSFIAKSITQSYNFMVEGNLIEAKKSLALVTDQQLWHQIEDKQTRADTMMRVAILDSTIEWYSSFDESKTLALATSLIGLLELEGDSEAYILNITTHLTELLNERT